MDIEKLIEAVKLCGSTPKVDQCKRCAYWFGGDMSKCIPRMTTAAATALSTLQAENERLRKELEYEREHANAYHEECSRWEAENEKLLAENIRWGQVASEQDKAIDNLSKELERKDMVIELAQRKQQEAQAALRREQDG